MTLAKPNDPYITDKGEVITTNGLMDAISDGDVSLGAPAARKLVSTQRRTIKDLPSDPKSQTAINAVLVFQMLGMTDNEISHITHISHDDLVRLKHLPAYQETFDILFHEMININSHSLQAKIASFAGDALANVMKIATESKQDMARLKANTDMLDRAGLHPETLFGKNKQDDGFDSLKIVIQNGEDKTHQVDIDIQKR
jgi:hypothetical protein